MDSQLIDSQTIDNQTIDGQTIDRQTMDSQTMDSQTIDGKHQPPSFERHWQQLEWHDLTLRINSKTDADVERALCADRLTREDMMALLSPAAGRWLEPLAQRAQQLTRSVSATPSVSMCRCISPTYALTTAPTAVFP